MIDPIAPNYEDTPGRSPLIARYQQNGSTDAVPVVSILTAYFNTGEVFLETVQCVLNQSLTAWEWIIVDDGSTAPEAVRQVEAVSRKDFRIRLIRQDNRGPSEARNHAFRKSRGRYVCLLDSDDMIEPTYLEKCVWFLESNAEFAFCNAWTVVCGDENYLFSQGFERGAAHLSANVGPIFAVIRREAFEDTGGFDVGIQYGHEDWDFWLAMAMHGHWGHTLPEYLQWYRRHSSGRFGRFLQSKDDSVAFDERIRAKYAHLSGAFPEPRRGGHLPYQSLPTWPPFRNVHSDASAGGILFVVPWMVTGGADRVNLDLVEGLVSGATPVTICATLSANHVWAPIFDALTKDVYVLPNFIQPIDYPRFISYILETRRIKCVVVTGSTIGYQLLPYLRPRHPGVAFVDLCHAEEPQWLNGGHPRFGVGYQDLLDLNLVTTRHLAKWMVGRGADESRIRVLHTGAMDNLPDVAVGARERIHTRLGLRPNVPTIIFAGRLCHQKRPLTLVAILAALQKEGANFQAIIVGDGELRQATEDAVKSTQLGGVVRMLGSVPHAEWLELVSASDIFLLPSEYEGISVALLEAMGAGVVPVVSHVGGHAEVVVEGAGHLIPCGEGEIVAYREALIRLLRSADRRRAMGTIAREVVDAGFTKDATNRRFKEFVQEAIELAARGPRCQVTAPMGAELTTSIMELWRMEEAVAKLLHERQTMLPAARASVDSGRVAPVSGAERVVHRLVARAFSNTRIDRLVRAPVVKRIGKRVLAAIEARSE